MNNLDLSFWIAAVSTILAGLLFWLLTGRQNLFGLITGTDQRLSTSKFQWVLWILVLFFAYLTIYSARCLVNAQFVEPMSEIPENVLAVLGISTLTVVTAKGITQSLVANGLVNKPEGDPTQNTASNPSFLINDDENVPDPYKLQIFLWTVLAVAVYIITLFSTISYAKAAGDKDEALKRLNMPDIDRTLMLISGLSAAGYLGKKIVTRDAPTISSITPSITTAGSKFRLTILGSNFGLPVIPTPPTPNNATVYIGNNDYKKGDKKVVWGDTQITVDLDANALQTGNYQVAVIVDGVKSDEKVLQVSEPPLKP